MVSLTNTGNLLNATPTQAAISVAGGLTLRNSGFIEGNVTATQSANIFNSGIIDGNLSLNAYNDFVRISGTVMGDVLLGNGVNVFWLTGGRVMGRVIGGAGADTYHVDRTDVTILDTTGGRDKVYSSVDFQLSPGIEELYIVGNARSILGMGNAVSNVIVGNGGSDTLYGLSGDDSLDGAESNNRLFGGAGNDTLVSGTGDDFLACGAGNDLVFAGFGKDSIYGGYGEDMLSFARLTDPAGATANLSTNTASFTEVNGMIFSLIEDLQGTAFADNLTGSNGKNLILGGGGADSLFGLGDNDTLVGGAQGDVLDGGSGVDVFVFLAVQDSAAAGGFDTINGFQANVDVIDLSAIDAVPGGTDDAFAFIGTQDFTGVGAEVRYEKDMVAGTTTIEVRLPGSAVDDMDIVLNGLFNLGIGNFGL